MATRTSPACGTAIPRWSPAGSPLPSWRLPPKGSSLCCNGASSAGASPAATQPAGRSMKGTRLLPAAVLGLAALAACGAPGSSAIPDGGIAGQAVARPVSLASLPRQPGAVTIGSADFPEDEILAYIYADAMKARGVTVSVHADIGERPAYIAALSDGSIGAVPEYSGS